MSVGTTNIANGESGVGIAVGGGGTTADGVEVGSARRPMEHALRLVAMTSRIVKSFRRTGCLRLLGSPNYNARVHSLPFDRPAPV